MFMPYFWVLPALACGAVYLVYLLYNRGLLAAKSIRALLFVFLPGKTGSRFALDACTGWVRYPVRFQEGGVYAFTLDALPAKGDAECLLLDRNGEILKLTARSPAGRAALEGRRRYYLRWRFQNASGRCELRWHSLSA